MNNSMSFDEWFTIVKSKIEQAGLPLPEDIERLQLLQMECDVESISIDDFIKEYTSSF